jgi:hypothetical protein
MEGKMTTPAKSTPKTNPKAPSDKDSSKNNDEKLYIVKQVLKKHFKDGDEKFVKAFYEQLDDEQVKKYKESESFRDEVEADIKFVIGETNKEVDKLEDDLIQKEVAKINPVLERIVAGRKKTLIDYIKCGRMILTAKQTVDSDKLDEALTDDIVSLRQRQRYVKIVVKPSSYVQFAKLGANPSPEDYAEIDMDSRVLDLTVEGIKNFKHASMSKLAEIKLFDPENKSTKYVKKFGDKTVFDLIIGGNQEVYDSEVEAAKDGKTETDGDLPNGITKAELKETMKKGAQSLAIDVHVLKKENSELKDSIEALRNDLKSLRNNWAQYAKEQAEAA